MAFMEWLPEHSVGVAVFDDEHKKMIAIVNRLYDCIAAGAGKDTLKTVTEDLIEYAVMHFRHEEMYFHDWDYPLAEEHAALHREMRQQVFKFRAEVDERNAGDLALEMLHFLRGWITQHIMVDDKKYGAFLVQKGLRSGGEL